MIEKVFRVYEVPQISDKEDNPEVLNKYHTKGIKMVNKTMERCSSSTIIIEKNTNQEPQDTIRMAFKY